MLKVRAIRTGLFARGRGIILLFCLLFVSLSAEAQINPFARQRTGERTIIRSGMTYYPDSIEKMRIDSTRRAQLVEKLCKLNGVVINGCHEAPHILSLSIPGIPTQNIINYLQEDGICVSAGSACAKGHRSQIS